MSAMSWLIAAATRINLLEKSSAVNASVAIFDLEDGLAKDAKAQGRQDYLAAFRARHPSGARIALRINALSSRWGLQDILFLAEEDAVPDIVILPRCGGAREVELVAELLAPLRPAVTIYPVIETLRGLRALREIAHAPARLGGFHLGLADLSAEIGVPLHRANLDFHRAEFAFAAKSLGVAAIDSPCFRIGDERVLRAECESSLRLGFDGKVAIHPSQVPVINEMFGLTRADIECAQAIVARHADDAIVQVEGDMTGPPFVRYAEKVLQQACSTHRLVEDFEQ